MIGPMLLWAGWDKCFRLDSGRLIVQFAPSIRLSGVQDVQGSSGSQVQGMLQDLARRALRVRCRTDKLTNEAYFQG